MHKYDFILPLGATCVTAHNLRKNGLQKEALPFDWVWIPSISTINILFDSNFISFFNKENLQFIRNNGDADIYKDVHNHMEFWHDFMAGKDFDESYLKIKNKYNRRIERTVDYINKANSILLFRVVKIKEQSNKKDDYLFNETKHNPQDLIDEINNFQQLFPNKNIELLLVYAYNKNCEFKEYDINQKIHICEMYNGEEFGWQGNEELFTKILQKYRLTFKGKFRYLISSIKFKISKLVHKLLYRKN